MTRPKKTRRTRATTREPTGKPKNVRAARTEMRCVRCRRTIQTGRTIYLLAHVGGALPPATEVACSHKCRTRWQAQHPEPQARAPSKALPDKSHRKHLPAVTETRTEIREGVDYTVTVYKEKKPKAKDSLPAVRRQS